MAGRIVLFIIGSPRSGSTLVSLIAGSHSRAFAIGEAEGIAAALDRQRRSGRPTPCLCCAETCEVWGRPDLSRHLAREARRPARGPVRPWSRFRRPFYAPIFEATGAQVLVDSSKRTDWLDRRLATSRDWSRAEARLLFATRDGRGSVHSWSRKAPDRPLEAHVEKWLRHVAQAEAAYARFPEGRKMRIAYEDLACEPDAAARRITDFLGLPPEPGMGAYWLHRHHILRGNAGTISLIGGAAERRALVEEIGSEPRRDFYRGLGQAIRPDESWRTAMSRRDLETFDRLAGAANAAYACAAPAGDDR